MCQAPIGKVISVSEGRLVVECKGEKVELKSKLSGVGKGDYVMFSSSIAIDKFDEEEAKMILGEKNAE